MCARIGSDLPGEGDMLVTKRWFQLGKEKMGTHIPERKMVAKAKEKIFKDVTLSSQPNFQDTIGESKTTGWNFSCSEHLPCAPK